MEQGARYYAQSPLHAEMKAIYMGIEYALHAGFYHIRIQSDCLIAIKLLTGDDITDHRAITILRDIRYLFCNFQCVTINYLSKALNRKSHNFAKISVCKP